MTTDYEPPTFPTLDPPDPLELVGHHLWIQARDLEEHRPDTAATLVLIRLFERARRHGSRPKLDAVWKGIEKAMVSDGLEQASARFPDRYRIEAVAGDGTTTERIDYRWTLEEAIDEARRDRRFELETSGTPTLRDGQEVASWRVVDEIEQRVVWSIDVDGNEQELDVLAEAS